MFDSRVRPSLLVLALLPALLALPASGPAVRTALTRPVAASCPLVTYGDVVGTAPSYLPHELTDYWGRRAVCRARWLGGSTGRFVPQGIAVDGSTMWVSGYDAGAENLCRVLRLSLPSLRVEAAQTAIRGRLSTGSTSCRHGGGIAVQGGRLWLMDTARLWLIDRSAFGRRTAVQRVWRLDGAVRGSTGVLRGGQLGLGRYSLKGTGRVDWYDTDRLVASHSEVISDSDRVDRVRNGLQGLAVGRLRPSMRPRLWRTFVGPPRCSVLLGPGARRAPVMPSVEGLAFGGGGVWVLSEASADLYYDDGPDPVVPQLVRYSASRLDTLMTSTTGHDRADRCLARIG